MTLSSPSPLASFDGQTFDSDTTLNGFSSVPPDPSLAVSAQYVVTTSNGSIEWFGRDGTLQHAQTLDSLMSAGGSVTGTFDPKIVYDAAANRFVVAATNGLEVFIAVSKTGNPNDGWVVGAASAIMGAGQGNRADFTALATNGRSIFVTANIFDAGGTNFLGSQLFTWQNAYSTMAQSAPPQLPPASAFDPSFDTGLPLGSALDTLQPAKMLDTPPGQTGTFLVSYSGARDPNTGHSIVSIIRVDDPNGGPPADANRQSIDVGLIDGGNGGELFAPQLGGGMQVDAGDSRVTDAVWRGGYLYVVATVTSRNAANLGVPEVHWFKFNTANLAAITLVDQGEVDGSAIAPGTATFDGSIAVDARGSFIINFAASGPGIHPGAYYALHGATDAAGTLETPAALALGQDSYVQTLGGSLNRWGDFSAAVVDPSNPRAFWLFNEYALAQGAADPSTGNTGRWGTRVGEVLDDHAPVVSGLNPVVHGGQPTAASLFGATDADSDAITQWDLWDPIVGNGGFTLNGVAQAARQEVIVSSLAGLAWDTTGEAGSTVVAVRAYDGFQWSAWTNVTINLSEHAPVVSGLNPVVHGGQVSAASLFGATDPDGDPITQWDLWDPLVGNGGFTLNGAPEPARQEVLVPSLAGLAWDTTGEAGSTVVAVRAFDGYQWSDWATVSINLTEHAPVVNALNPTVHSGQVAATSLFSATDPDGDPITQWDLWDPIAGNGGFTLNGAPEPARQEVLVPSLAGLAWDTTGETSSTVVAVRAFDGYQWSDWTTVSINTANRAPVASGSNVSLHGAQRVAASSLFGATDPDGDAITQWDLWDPIAGNGGFTLNGAPQPARQEVLVPSLAGLAWDTTGEAGPTVVAVRAFDGSLWSDWATVNINLVEHAPVAAGLNPTVHNGTVAASSLFGATDPDGDPITQWDLWDPIAGNGGFTLNGAPQPARQEVLVSSLAGLVWDTTGETGPTVVAVRAFDGSLWSDWATVSVNMVNSAPVVAAAAGASGAGSSINGVTQIAASSLFGASDADGDAITQWDLWDPIAGNGGFTLNGAPEPARQEVLVSSLAGLAWDTTGQTGPTSVAVRAFDGSLWSEWTSVAVPVPAPLAPVTSSATQQLASALAAAPSGAAALAGGSLSSATDPTLHPVLAPGHG